jgi:hypothetical protein
VWIIIGFLPVVLVLKQVLTYKTVDPKSYLWLMSQMHSPVTVTSKKKYLEQKM